MVKVLYEHHKVVRKSCLSVLQQENYDDYGATDLIEKSNYELHLL